MWRGHIRISRAICIVWKGLFSVPLAFISQTTQSTTKSNWLLGRKMMEWESILGAYVKNDWKHPKVLKYWCRQTGKHYTAWISKGEEPVGGNHPSSYLKHSLPALIVWIFLTVSLYLKTSNIFILSGVYWRKEKTNWLSLVR